MKIAIIVLTLVVVAAVVVVRVVEKWSDREYRRWKEWFDKLPSDERRKIQEQIYKEHI